MRMKLPSSLLLIAFCSIRNRLVNSQSESLPDTAGHRELYNDKWPPKQIPVRRYHQWAYSGSATSAQYRKGTNRAVGHRDPEKDDDYYYYDKYEDKENYYYGPAEGNSDKRPSEQEFEYYDKIPKHVKSDGKGGKGKVGKSTKHDDCPNYHYEYEHEGGKGKGSKTTKSSKSSKKTKVCTDPPCKYSDKL